MADVVSLGSVNVDRTRYLDSAAIEALAEDYDWFPAAGETVAVDAVPEALVEESYENFLGGKGSNQAVAAARAGADAALLGKIGHDAGRYDVREKLRNRGVAVEHVEPAREPTGKAYIFVDETGESHIVVVPGANAEVSPSYVRPRVNAVADAGCLLFQNETPPAATLNLLDALAGDPYRPIVVFDPAPVEGTAALVDHEAVDIVSPNATEYDQLADELAGAGKTLVRRRGPDPVVVEPDSGDAFTVSTPDVDPVDATGAGDVFNGYLAAELARGEPLRDAVELATRAASVSTELAGAQQAIPTRDELDSYLA